MDKKTITFRKMIEKESELYRLSFYETNALIDAILESCDENIIGHLYDTKCVNCYRGIINAVLLRDGFEVIPIELQDDWISEMDGRQYDKVWILGKIAEISKWLGKDELYIEVEDTTYSCPHSVTTDAIENAGRELITRAKSVKTEGVFKGVLFRFERNDKQVKQP